MKKDLKAELSAILGQIDSSSYVHSDEIPAIDLYMDQVTTFMDQHLGHTRRSGEDKVLTKTMINNYTKNKLLPPPEKKKYSADHMLLLIFIYYYKNVLSLQDIQALLSRLPKECQGDHPDIKAVYDEIFDVDEIRLQAMKKDVNARVDRAAASYLDVPEDDRTFFQLFSLISDLALDVYLKKHIIERLIDEMLDEEG